MDRAETGRTGEGRWLRGIFTRSRDVSCLAHNSPHPDGEIDLILVEPDGHADAL